VAKGQDAGVTQQDIVAHRKDAQYEHLDEHPLPELGITAFGPLHEGIEEAGSILYSPWVADNRPSDKRKKGQDTKYQQVAPPSRPPMGKPGFAVKR
jgi:hypothetical protein